MTEKDWLKQLKECDDKATRLAFADWLEEQERPFAAAHQRKRAGVSTIWYELVYMRKDGKRESLGRWARPKNALMRLENRQDKERVWTIEVIEVQEENLGTITEEQLRSKLRG